MFYQGCTTLQFHLQDICLNGKTTGLQTVHSLLKRKPMFHALKSNS